MKRVYGLPVLTVGLLALACNIYALSWLVVVALLPYIYFLEIQQSVKKPRIVLVTWLMGLFTSLLIGAWLATADTAGWLRTDGLTLQLAIFSVWLLLGVSLSLGYLLLGACISYFYRRLSFMKLVTLILPATWVISEFLRSFMISVIAYGRGAELGAHYNFGVLGLPATATELGFASRLIGLFGMTALAVYVNVLLYVLLKKRWQLAGVISAGLIGVTIAGYYWPTSLHHPVLAGVVRLPADTVRYPDAQSSQLRELATHPLDILVLPEYADFLETASPSQQKAILDHISTNGVLVYTRHGPKIDGKPTNQTVVVNKAGQVVATRQKSFLVPTGEYLPWIIQGGLKIGGQQRLIDEFNNNIAIAPSTAKESPVAVSYTKLGILACSGAITFDGYQGLSRDGATVLVNPASLVQFRNSLGFAAQDHQFARFQAISLNRPFLQASRGSHSWLMDGNGKVLPSAAMIRPNVARTVTGRWGEWYVGVSIVVLSIAAWLTTGNWRTRRRST